MVNLQNFIKAGNVHKQIRHYIHPYLKEDTPINEIVYRIESKIESELPDELNGGIGFPTGISLNNVAAHYTPSKSERRCLKKNDVCKIDYGVHVDGCIVDSAFTINLDNQYSKILEASKEAVDSVIKHIGVDVKFSELGSISQEIVESYEYDNKPLKVIDNLCGHTILPWKVHGGKLLHGIPKPNDDQIVEDNDVIAVEIFVSNGNGTCMLDTNTDNYSHYMLKDDTKQIPLFKQKKINVLSEKIKTKFKTLPFCPRFLDNVYDKPYNYNHNLQTLFNAEILNSYPPLLETDPNSKVAQFEHTVFVSETRKIILS